MNWLNNIPESDYSYSPSDNTLTFKVPFPSRCDWGKITVPADNPVRKLSDGSINIGLPAKEYEVEFENGDVDTFTSDRVVRNLEMNREDLATIREAMKDPLQAVKQYPSLSEFMAKQLGDETVSDIAQYYNDLKEDVYGD